MNDVVKLTRALVDIPSVTGEEEAVAQFVFRLLKSSGWDSFIQEVAPGRGNVFASRGTPTVLLTTHLDTVPPFIASREDETHVWGRGSCDAKGIAAAMICAAEALTAAGRSGFGLLFVVGEETDSVGASRACELEIPCRYLIDGEPTDNQLAVGHKGVVQARLVSQGRAAHSAYPEEGESAIDKLIDTLVDLRRVQWPRSDLLGDSHLNVGKISGGTAGNVIPDRAEALLLLRSVVSSSEYVERLKRAAGERVQVEILKTAEPQEMEVVEGFARKVVGFGTDIPILRRLGRPLLIGPGSILDAHTAGEKVSKRELADAVGLYAALVSRLQSGSHGSDPIHLHTSTPE